MARVLVAIDDSEVAVRTLSRAASTYGNPGWELHVVTVLEPVVGHWVAPPHETHGGDINTVQPREPDPLVVDTQERARSVIEDAGVECQNLHIRYGQAAREIVELGRELSADLIVVGSHGKRGLVRVLLGSTASSVLNDAGCDVLVIRPDE